MDHLTVHPIVAAHSVSAPSSPRRTEATLRPLLDQPVEPPMGAAGVDTLRRVKTVSAQDADVSVLPGDIILQAARPRLM